jgi:hypothetical protein
MKELGWTKDALPPGARVVTFGEEDGVVWALDSQGVHGRAMPPPADVLAAIMKKFDFE